MWNWTSRCLEGNEEMRRGMSAERSGWIECLQESRRGDKIGLHLIREGIQRYRK